MKNPPIRWGILGTANIARKNWKAIQLSGNSVVTAVASRSADRSQQFIRECQSEVPMPAPPRAFGTYEELLASSEVDAVYIPLPTGLRKPWVIRAAELGKHVLCEKPCATSAADLREMLEACRSNQVQFMDGVMFMHGPRLARIRQSLASKSIGSIRRISSSFSFCASSDFFKDNIRGDHTLEPHGCLGDLGWYCLRFYLMAMEGRMPEEVTGSLLSQSRPGTAGIPTGFSGELHFSDGVSAGFYTSFLTHDEQRAVISGDTGSLSLVDFVLPFSGQETQFDIQRAEFHVRGCDFRMERHLESIRIPEHSHGHPTAQESLLFRNFSNLVLSGNPDPFWPEIALKTQILMNACHDSALQGGRCIRIDAADTTLPAT